MLASRSRRRYRVTTTFLLCWLDLSLWLHPNLTSLSSITPNMRRPKTTSSNGFSFHISPMLGLQEGSSKLKPNNRYNTRSNSCSVNKVEKQRKTQVSMTQKLITEYHIITYARYHDLQFSSKTWDTRCHVITYANGYIFYPKIQDVMFF